MSVNISNHGAHINAEPVTTTVAGEASPELLRSHVDERIARIRPSSTPLDQISRMVGARHAGSMKVDYYSVDVRQSEVVLKSDFSISPSGFGQKLTVNFVQDDLLAKSDTLLIPEAIVTDASGNSRPLVVYVHDKNRGSVTIVPTGEPPVAAVEVKKTYRVIRMGRAAGELDVQTAQYSALPRKAFNYCQIFKAQVEESMLQRLSDKEVGWTFSDHEESAIIDMRLGMEKSFLFGTRSIVDIDEPVMLTGGVWAQAGKEFEYTPGSFDNRQVISLMRKAFEKGGGSSRKVLLAGSDLIERINCLEATRVVGASEKKTVWGIDFDCITSKFGTIYVKVSEIFDLCGMSDCGIIIDPEYISKYSHIPFRAERISFHKQGVRNTEAVVLTEASCLVLRYPDAHMRIVPAKADDSAATE